MPHVFTQAHHFSCLVSAVTEAVHQGLLVGIIYVLLMRNDATSLLISIAHFPAADDDDQRWSWHQYICTINVLPFVPHKENTNSYAVFKHTFLS